MPSISQKLKETLDSYKTNIYKTNIGDVRTKLYFDPEQGMIGGQLTKSILGHDVSLGAENEYGAPAAYNLNIGDDEMGITSRHQGNATDVSAHYGHHAIGLSNQNEKTTPYYGFSENNLNLGVSPNRLNANVNIPVGKDGTLDIGGTLAHQGNVLNASYKKLFDSGYLDVNGNITPEGYKLMVGGKFHF